MSNVLPLHAKDPVFAEPSGRPGEWWEPIGIAAADVGLQVRAEAEARRLRIDLVATLLIETALVIRDATWCGISPAADALTDETQLLPSSGPGCLYTAYVQTLRAGTREHRAESDRQLARRDLLVPLRLHQALLDLDLRACWTERRVDTAIAWEIAAATSGEFMREWALRRLLRKAAARSAFG